MADDDIEDDGREEEPPPEERTQEPDGEEPPPEDAGASAEPERPAARRESPQMLDGMPLDPEPEQPAPRRESPQMLDGMPLDPEPERPAARRESPQMLDGMPLDPEPQESRKSDEEQRGTLADIGAGALHGVAQGAMEFLGPVARGVANLGGAVGLTDDPQNSWLHKVGEDIEKNAATYADYLPKPQGAAGQFVEGVGRTIGSIAPAIAAGPLAIAVLLGTSGAAQEGDASKQATGQQSTGATLAGGAVGAAGGVAIAKLAPLLGKILPTVERTAPGLYDWARSTLLGAAREGTVFGGVNEAMEALHDQIAQKFYDPNAGYHPDIQRLMTSLAAGAVIGGARGARERVPEPAAAGESPIPGVPQTKGSEPITDPARLLPKPADFTVSSEGEAARYPGGDDQVFADAAAPRAGGAQEDVRPVYEKPYQRNDPAAQQQRQAATPVTPVDNPRGASVAQPAPKDASNPAAVSPSENPVPAIRDGSQSGPGARQYAKGAAQETPPAPPSDLSTVPADIQAARDASMPAPKEVMPNGQQPVPPNNVATPPREGPTPPAAAPSGDGMDIPDFLQRKKGEPPPSAGKTPFAQAAEQTARAKRDFTIPKGGLTPEAEQIRADQEAAAKTKADARFADLKANREAKKRQEASFLPPKVQAAKDAIDAAAAKTNPAPTIDTLRPSYDALVKDNGGISTVYIGDLIAKSGLPKAQVHDLIRAAAQRGDVSINQSSLPTGRLSADRTAGAIDIPGEQPYHTVTFKKEAPQRAAEEHVEESASKAQEDTLADALNRFKADEGGSARIPGFKEDPIRDAIRTAEDAPVPGKHRLGLWFTHRLAEFGDKAFGENNPLRRIRDSWEERGNRFGNYLGAHEGMASTVEKMNPDAQDVFNQARRLDTDPSKPYDDRSQPKARHESEPARELLHGKLKAAYDALPEAEKAKVQALREHVHEHEGAVTDQREVNRVLAGAEAAEPGVTERLGLGTYLPFVRWGKVSLIAKRHMPDRPAGAEQATDADGNPVAKYTFRTKDERDRFSRQLVEDGHNMPTDREVYTDKTGNTINPETKRPFTAEDAKDDPELEKRHSTDVELLHLERFDTRRDANRAREQYKKDGTFAAVDVQPKPWQAGAWGGLGMEVERSIDSALRNNKYYHDLDPTQKAAVKDTLMQAKMDVMGATKTVNPRMHQRGISGASDDLMRAFQDWAKDNAGTRARLDMQPKEDAAWRDLRAATEPNTGDPKTSYLRKALAVEMERRKKALDRGEATLRDSLGSRLINRALTASQIARLATPRFLIQNSFQPAQRTLPWTIARYGLSPISAAKHLYQTAKDLGIADIYKTAWKETKLAARGQDFRSSVFSDLLDRIKDPTERTFLQTLANMRGGWREQAQQGDTLRRTDSNLRLDVGTGGNALQNAAVEAAERGLNILDKGLTRLSDIAAPLNAAVELVNRTHTGLDVFRHEMARHGDAAKATQAALDAVDQTQINYSKASEPPWMHSNQLLRVPTQFKKYGLQTFGFIMRHAHNIATGSPAQRKEGMYQLGGMMATTVLFAGAAGLPLEQLVSPILTGLKASGLTDKDWNDVDMAVRETTTHALGRAFGLDEMGRPGFAAQKTASVLAGGIPRLIGLDMTNNLGQNNMITNQAPKYAKVGSGEYYGNVAKWLAEQAGGSVGGMGADLFKATNDLVHGDPVSALQRTPIKLASDIVKAGAGLAGKGAAFQSERGVTRGKPYTVPEAIAKGAGFSLASDAERQAFTFGQLQKRKEAAGAKTDAITAYIKNPTAETRRAAVQSGVTPQALNRALVDVRRQNVRNVNGLTSTPRTRKADEDAAANYYITR